MNNLEHVKQLIESKLKDSVVEVSDLTGTMDHLNIITFYMIKYIELINCFDSKRYFYS